MCFSSYLHILPICAVLFLFGCSKNPSGPESNQTQSTADEGTDSHQPSIARKERLTTEEWQDLSIVVKGNNEFALDLYGRLRAQPRNIVFSPYSISSALAMTYAGARSDTALQMAKTLHFRLPQDRLHPAFANLFWQLQGSPGSRANNLRIANALWGQSGYQFNPDFLEVTQSNYGAGLQAVDFKADPAGARQKINEWASKQTQGKIGELLGEDDINRQCELVLTNALYFKNEWTKVFPEKNTKQEDFFVSPTHAVKVSMMHVRGDFSYYQNGECQILVLPYKRSPLQLVIILPSRVEGLSDLENKLTGAMLDGLMEKCEFYDVDVAMPKFKMATNLKLREELTKLGMKLPFSDAANFDGIFAKTHSQGVLQLSDVKHVSRVEVKESGTEAAASTAVIAFVPLVEKKPLRTAIIRADRPFLFFIRERDMGALVFMGRLKDPER